MSGPIESGIGKHSNSHTNQIGALRGCPEDSPPAVWTEVERHGPTAVCPTGVLLRDTAGGLDLFARIPCLNAEGASCSTLAFEAVAHRNTKGVAVNGQRQLSATASGFTTCHARYLSTG